MFYKIKHMCRWFSTADRYFNIVFLSEIVIAQMVSKEIVFVIVWYILNPVDVWLRAGRAGVCRYGHIHAAGQSKAGEIYVAQWTLSSTTWWHANLFGNPSDDLGISIQRIANRNKAVHELCYMVIMRWLSVLKLGFGKGGSTYLREVKYKLT